jgi:phosphonate transport system substrate-binding protein
MQQGMRGAILLLLAVSFSYLSCTHEQPAQVSVPTQTLTIGLIPEQNVFEQKKRYRVFCDYLSRQMGINVRTRLLGNYGQAIEEFQEARIDGAFLGSYLSAVVLKFFPTTVLARPVWLDGTSGYKGLVIARKDSEIGPDVRSWKGRSFGLVHTHTSAGYLFPLDLVRSAGVKNVESFFGPMKMFGSHDAVVLAVLEGRVDLGACKSTIYNRMRGKEPELESIEVLAVSEEFPSNGLILRDEVPHDLAKELRSLMTSLHESEEGRAVLEALQAEKFVDTNPADYHPVFEFMERLNIAFVPEPSRGRRK